MDRLVVLDFGGQYAHLIAKRFRALGYYSEIELPTAKTNSFEDAKGIIFSGGPASVYGKEKPDFNEDIVSLNIPILGLCYGHQLLAYINGGKVEKAKIGEFGFAEYNALPDSELTQNIKFPTQVWMSHSDEVVSLPEDYSITGTTKDCKIASYQSNDLMRFGFQFHAEVKDTPIGDKIFDNFARYCNMPKNWKNDMVLDMLKNNIIKEAGNKNVLLFLSGGVDSSVAFALLNEALGKEKVLGLYINNGFMRKNETDRIEKRYKDAEYDNFIIEDASDFFLEALKGLIDPQEKRKAVGDAFLRVRERVLTKLNLAPDQWLLAQGTLYPDIIESGGTKNSHVIKTHHNRVDEIQRLIDRGLVIEPLKDLYKDEVRVIGKQLGLADELVYRHPFPGPGLSINVLCSNGEFNEEAKIHSIRERLDELAPQKFFKGTSILSYPLPVKSVGVQGDFRTYSFPIVIAVDNIKENLPDWEILNSVSSYLTNNIKDVNRTVLELFVKSPLKLIKSYCNKERLDMLREVDSIVINILRKTGWYNKIFQHLSISLPYASSSDKCSIVLRPVVSEDVMTASFARLDKAILQDIIEEVYKLDFVDALFYDITNKPPATFGWE